MGRLDRGRNGKVDVTRRESDFSSIRIEGDVPVDLHTAEAALDLHLEREERIRSSPSRGHVVDIVLDVGIDA
jgi:hypothetical protein